MDLREYRADSPFRRHPWETVRAAFFARVVREFVDASSVGAHLDVGAGDGWLAGRLLDELPFATATCVDTGYEDGCALPDDVANAERILCATEIPGERFDLVSFMDLLEHVDDPEAMLRTVIREHSTRGAHVLVSVPAWERLYCSHDATFSHRRRYSRKELRALLEGAGLERVADGGLFHAALFPRTLRVIVERMRGVTRTAHEPRPLKWSGSESTAKFVEGVLTAEANASFTASKSGAYVPGLTAWALYRVP